MFWKKHKKKILWCLALLAIAIGLTRATPLYRVILYRRVWYDIPSNFDHHNGRRVIGWHLVSRFQRATPEPVPLKNWQFSWFADTGLLWLRVEPMGKDDAGERFHVTYWHPNGEIYLQQVITGGTWDREYEQITEPPWRWGAKPCTPATRWMKARWIP